MESYSFHSVASFLLLFVSTASCLSFSHPSFLGVHPLGNAISHPFSFNPKPFSLIFGFVVQMRNIIALSSSSVRMDQNPSLETVLMMISVTVLMVLMNLVCAIIYNMISFMSNFITNISLTCYSSLIFSFFS